MCPYKANRLKRVKIVEKTISIMHSKPMLRANYYFNEICRQNQKGYCSKLITELSKSIKALKNTGYFFQVCDSVFQCMDGSDEKYCAPKQEDAEDNDNNEVEDDVNDEGTGQIVI